MMRRSLMILLTPFVGLFCVMGVTQLISYLGRQRPADVLSRAVDQIVTSQLDGARVDLSASRLIYLQFTGPDTVRIAAQSHNRVLRPLSLDQAVSPELRAALPTLTAGSCAATANLEFSTVTGLGDNPSSAITCPVMQDGRAVALAHITFFGPPRDTDGVAQALTRAGDNARIAFDACGAPCAGI